MRDAQQFARVDQDEGKACPSKNGTEKSDPATSSPDNFFQEKGYSHKSKRKQSKPTRSSLGNLFSARAHLGYDGFRNLFSATSAQESDASENKIGMEESGAVRTLDSNCVTCERCGGAFSSAQHSTQCAEEIQKKKYKAFRSKAESPVGKDGARRHRVWSCSLCGLVCRSMQSLGGHKRACLKKHVENMPSILKKQAK